MCIILCQPVGRNSGAKRVNGVSLEWRLLKQETQDFPVYSSFWPVPG